MRILIVSQYFWPEGFRINEVALTLVEQGHEVDVLTGKPNYPEGKIGVGYSFLGLNREQYCGINVVRVPLFPRGRGSGFRLFLNYSSFIMFGVLLGPWLLRDRKYHVVFVYGVSPLLSAFPGLLLAYLKNAPLAVWVQDLWPQSLVATGYVKSAFILSAVECLVRFIYRHTDLLLVQSRAFVDDVRKMSGGTPIKFYPNSVDNVFLKPSSVGLPDVEGLDAPFSVVFAGNVGFAQSVEVIVGAATLLQEYGDIHFIVLGDGSRRDWMRNEVERLGLKNVHLPGRFPVEMMPGFMSKASVLLATLADREIFAITVPNKVQAYMAVGRPIIACMNGEGARLVVEAGAGVSVRAESAQDLAAAVLLIYGMSESERAEFGRNAQAFYRTHFDHDKLVLELADCFGDLVGARR